MNANDDVNQFIICFKIRCVNACRDFLLVYLGVSYRYEVKQAKEILKKFYTILVDKCNILTIGNSFTQLRWLVFIWQTFRLQYPEDYNDDGAIAMLRN